MKAHRLKKIKGHPSLLYAEEIRSIGKPLKSLGVDYFSKGRVSIDGKFSCLGSDALFVEDYLLNQHYNSSMHAEPTKLGSMLFWDSATHFGQSLRLHEIKKRFGLFNGFTLIKKHSEYYDYYHFASFTNNPSVSTNYLTHLNDLHLFAHLLDEKILNHKSLKEAYSIEFEIDNQLGRYEAEFASGDLINQQLLEGFSRNKLYLHYNNLNIQLSRRQIEILYWLSLGKTAEFIALICRISKSTVNNHIIKIKEISQCNNLFQLGQLFAAIKAHPAYELFIRG